MSHHLIIIRDIFPSQIYLTPKEIARVLHGPGRDTKKRAEDVRRQLDDGTLIPGLRKPADQKRWLVRIVDLARALDRAAELRSDDYNVRYVDRSAVRNSRFKNPGMRLVR